MAEYRKSKYYWIRITDSFLTSDTVDFLMGQKSGANYVVLYQMLCLKTVNNNGILARKIGEIFVPFDEAKIVRDCKWFDIDTVRVALTLYRKLGLIYEYINGIFRITDFENMVGSQTEGAKRKQSQRLRLGGGQKGGQKVDNCPPDIDIDIDKEIDIYKDKDSKYTNAHARTREETPLNNYTVKDIIALCEEVSPILHQRHKSKPNADYAVGKLLDELQLQYSLDDIRSLLTHANKTFHVLPKYKRCDLVYILANAPTVLSTEEKGIESSGGSNDIPAPRDYDEEF